MLEGYGEGVNPRAIRSWRSLIQTSAAAAIPGLTAGFAKTIILAAWPLCALSVAVYGLAGFFVFLVSVGNDAKSRTWEK
jgi:hypothetical protein